MGGCPRGRWFGTGGVSTSECGMRESRAAARKTALDKTASDKTASDNEARGREPAKGCGDQVLGRQDGCDDVPEPGRMTPGERAVSGADRERWPAGGDRRAGRTPVMSS